MNRLLLLILILAVVLVPVVAGCSSGSDSKAGQTTVPGDYSSVPGKGAAGEKPTK